MLKHIPILGDYFVSKKQYKTVTNLLKDTQDYVNELKEELSQQKQINKVITDSKSRYSIVTVVGFDDNECEPSDPAKRAEYVKEVDIFYDNILKKKLTTSIADLRDMLSNIHVANGFPQNMQRNEYDFFLRGMEAMAWKMNEWAVTLQGERRESLQDKENQD